MYGYTPPAVIAIDPEWLVDAAGFQFIAAALQTQLSRRPVVAVVAAPERLVEAPAPSWVVETFYRDPRDAPEHVDDPSKATADALAQHLAELGAPIPVRFPTGQHPARSCIAPGTWLDAARIAADVGAAIVIAWARHPEYVPSHEGAIPFHYEAPPGPDVFDHPFPA